jgi:hypothetical protein
MGVDYWDNAALIIFEAATLEEVETMARNDLAMKAHAFQAQVRPFDVFWASNKFTPVCGRKDAPAEVTIEEVAA